MVYKLGQEIGAGGNGIVYTVSRRPELVAKIQKRAPSRDDLDKLDLLVRAATPDLLAVAAWPMDLLKAPNGHVVGHVMPRILDARPLYELYSPRSRIQHFPSADFRFLVHAAANVARLFAAVHRAGFICGDVNHSNILVRQTATVAAVDCDSFQVGDGSRFPCLVGTELFVPPELLGRSLGATRRTPNHDYFGLAVLIFHLLFMGRHPFAGRFLGRGDMPIERAIAEYRFAYSRDQARTRMAPPPFTPPIDTVGAAVAQLFEQAFDPQSANGSRPVPESWIGALDALKASLLPCKSVAWHHHPSSTQGCPWCAIEGSARVKLFGGVIRVAAAAIADLETLWARYIALVEPGPRRPLPVLPPKPRRRWSWPRPRVPAIPSPAQLVATAKQRLRSLAGRLRTDRVIGAVWVMVMAIFMSWGTLAAAARGIAGVALAGIDAVASWPWTPMTVAAAGLLVLLAGPILLWALRLAAIAVLRIFVKAPPVPAIPLPAKGILRIPLAGRLAARIAWAKAGAAWKGLGAPPDVSALRPPIELIKKELDALAVERDAAIRACAKLETSGAQCAHYLGTLRIEDAKLANIGPARCAVLRSWGIDTAADIDEAKIATIPGFGKNLTDKLVIWRDMKAKNFFPSTTPILDPHDVQRIDRKLAARRVKLMKDLREKITEVERRMGDYLKERDARWARIESAYQQRLACR
jgi:DNA-binding helix-hairpin-helix protein with protein kinase domain